MLLVQIGGARAVSGCRPAGRRRDLEVLMESFMSLRTAGDIGNSQEGLEMA